MADTIFTNGNVHTVNDAAPEAEAIAIKGERIVFVGSNEEAKKYSGPATRTIDLKGRRLCRDSPTRITTFSESAIRRPSRALMKPLHAARSSRG